MKPKCAIVCDWLTSFGGAERVIHSLHRLFPGAPIFTSVFDEKKLPQFVKANVVTSFIQKLPFAKEKYQYYLPLLPLAFEEFNLGDFDVVISSSHSAAKGVITKPRTLHISYCHTPMRYVWGNYHEYIREYGIPKILNPFMERILHRLRIWDRLAADRVDFFLANSRYIADRIHKYYRRSAEVLYPPVQLKRFDIEGKKQGKYFLALGRIIPYKKFDLVVEAFNELGEPLVIAGEGRSLKSLRKKAKSNITFLGGIPENQLPSLYKEAKALIFPQVEDFGITAVEAQACGTPVIGYADGGALETVTPGKTGLLFDEQTPESLKRAVIEFSGMTFSPSAIRKEAERFDEPVFEEKMIDFIEKKWMDWQK